MDLARHGVVPRRRGKARPNKVKRGAHVFRVDHPPLTRHKFVSVMLLYHAKKTSASMTTAHSIRSSSAGSEPTPIACSYPTLFSSLNSRLDSGNMVDGHAFENLSTFFDQ